MEFPWSKVRMTFDPGVASAGKMSLRKVFTSRTWFDDGQEVMNSAASEYTESRPRHVEGSDHGACVSTTPARLRRVARLGGEDRGSGGEVCLGGEVLRGTCVRGPADALEGHGERGERRGVGVREGVDTRLGRVCAEGVREEFDMRGFVTERKSVKLIGGGRKGSTDLHAG